MLNRLKTRKTKMCDAVAARELAGDEKFYAGIFYGVLSVATLANDLGVSVESVQTYFDQLKARGVKPGSWATEEEVLADTALRASRRMSSQAARRKRRAI